MFWILSRASPAVPLRFIVVICHIVLASLLLLQRPWNIAGCGQYVLNTANLFAEKDQQLIAALSLMIGFSGLEIISLSFGLSLYSNFQSLISAAFHTAACVSLLFFMFYRSCVNDIWSILATCSFIPFLTELITIFRSCVFRKLPPW